MNVYVKFIIYFAHKLISEIYVRIIYLFSSKLDLTEIYICIRYYATRKKTGCYRFLCMNFILQCAV